MHAMLAVLAGGASAPPAPASVFATSLYAGSSSPVVINNGLDMMSSGGLMLMRPRDGYVEGAGDASPPTWIDTVRGLSLPLGSEDGVTGTNGESDFASATYVSSVASNGYTIAASAPRINFDGYNHVSWAFRRQPRFFNVVTYTGNGADRTIAHGLAAEPGLIIAKRRDSSGNWYAWHRGLPLNHQLLNWSGASIASSAPFGATAPTTGVFSLPAASSVNLSGASYIAYLFAHDAFGIIQCGSFSTNSSGDATVSLGWAPQFLLLKRTDDVSDWFVMDTTRGWVNNSVLRIAYMNSGAVEADETYFWNRPTGTGFTINGGWGDASFIYMAIKAP